MRLFICVSSFIQPRYATGVQHHWSFNEYWTFCLSFLCHVHTNCIDKCTVQISLQTSLISISALSRARKIHILNIFSNSTSLWIMPWSMVHIMPIKMYGNLPNISEATPKTPCLYWIIYWFSQVQKLYMTACMEKKTQGENIIIQRKQEGCFCCNF